MKTRDFMKLTATGPTSATVGLMGGSGARARVQQDAETFLPESLNGNDFVAFKGPEATIAGYPLSWRDKHYGLPLHVHYGPAITANIKAFQRVFKARYPKGEIRFAAKANPHPSVFRLVAQAGEGVDVASECEAKGALMAGIDPRYMDVNGTANSNAFPRPARVLAHEDGSVEFINKRDTLEVSIP